MPHHHSYNSDDSIETLYTKEFIWHHLNMMYRTHGYWQPFVITQLHAEELIRKGVWDSVRELYAVAPKEAVLVN